jgi:hypothetical protein
MVKLKFIFCCVLCNIVLFGFSQNRDSSDTEEKFLIHCLSASPEYRGGYSEYLKFIYSNLKYPDTIVPLKKITVWHCYFILKI